MQITTEFPYAVTEIEHCTIELKDGVNLAVRMWLPELSEGETVPAILEYLPYRKRDGTAVRDALTHPWMAGHGYACIRVDIRGNGESQGLMKDEYLALEQQDALEVIDWICAQPWCNGNVGMMGISWGGFNSLQVAALRPKALKAIITLCSTDDRFRDDIHYKGGNLLLENLGWAATMLNFSAAVPDPLLVGDEWQSMWKNRLSNNPMLIKTWLEHQTRDEYWKHGSVCENYGDITAAVYAFGAWGDAYKNTVPRLMEHLPGPKKSVVGPWIHKYPHFAVPNPAIGFLQEAKKWWDHWLKGIDNGVMDEPASIYYIQTALPPQPCYEERPGFWVSTDSWPSSNVKELPYYLTSMGMNSTKEVLDTEKSVCSPNTVGVHQGEYCAIWFGPDGPTDQRRDDAMSLCFDSQPLKAPLTILGNPKLTLRLSSDHAGGKIVVRLNAVSPQGHVQQITYGTLNLAMDKDLSNIHAIEPNSEQTINLDLDHVGYQVPEGYQLRVAISTGSFPLLWPSKHMTTVTLLPQIQEILLPIFEGSAIENPFEEPVASQPANLKIHRKPAPSRQIHENVLTGEVCVEIQDDLGNIEFLDHGFWVDQRCTEKYRVLPYDPLSMNAEINWSYLAGRGEWSVSVSSKISLSADLDWFYIEAEQTAKSGDETIHQQTWHEKVARLS